MEKLHIDFEARSLVDLKKVGAYKYAAHPSTEILCMAYAIGDRPVQIIKYKEDFSELYTYFREVTAGRMVCTAFNAYFERCMFRFAVPRLKLMNPGASTIIWQPEYWQCTMAKSNQAGMTGSLDVVCQLLKMKDVKDREGKRIMMKMCKPRKPKKKELEQFRVDQGLAGLDPDAEMILWHETPEDFETLYNYCKQDVEVERGVDRRLPRLPDLEQKIWQIDQRINDTGVPVNMVNVSKAIILMEKQKIKANNQMQILTEFRVDAVTKVAGIKKELRMICKGINDDSYGYVKKEISFDCLDKQHLAELLETDIPEKAKEILTLRRDNGKSSTAKYIALKGREINGTVHGLFSYHHATTGRWGSRGIQLHNLPRGDIKDIDTALFAFENDATWMFPPLSNLLSCLIRTMFIATEGYDLIAADYAAIEARVLNWLAKQWDVVQRFVDFDNGVGEEPYMLMAHDIYEDDTLTKEENPTERFVGKQTELGSGFGMGSGRHNEQCKQYGIEIPFELSEKCIKKYRSSHKKVVSFWYGIERMVRNSITRRGTVFHRDNICAKTNKNFLMIKLVSGRVLYYYKPHFDSENSIRFWGYDTQKSRIVEQYTYGGKLVENIVQATARDILANALVTLEGTKYQSILHVHDEVVSLVREGQGDVDEYCDMVATLPDWAKGCPTKAEGWIGKFYKKD